MNYITHILISIGIFLHILTVAPVGIEPTVPVSNGVAKAPVAEIQPLKKATAYVTPHALQPTAPMPPAQIFTAVTATSSQYQFVTPYGAILDIHGNVLNQDDLNAIQADRAARDAEVQRLKNIAAAQELASSTQAKINEQNIQMKNETISKLKSQIAEIDGQLTTTLDSLNEINAEILRIGSAITAFQIAEFKKQRDTLNATLSDLQTHRVKLQSDLDLIS